MEWISVEDGLPEITETDWLGHKHRRVYWVRKESPTEVWEGKAAVNMGITVFWPAEQGRGHLLEDISHWMYRPLPEPPKVAATLKIGDDNGKAKR